ncbi:hypothetical protein ACIBCS_17735 [Streptomyces phaeochromogenes]|uniref:Uncharacterized protein n=1 Tax=Streptomyces phaeochromogenes TaxID=1923 RepID=A0ABZ1HMJ0_STRPH|nr:hypothetical protein [Streptomyces phaeochromogenes]MCX5598508.1 hypothetical protein [Streptomyces phaeochromogenes]WRZ33762.1 hypothetical protein OG931_41490 [Streptomyces phaeochromogenes]WSD19254.1 hypothetical protein OHB35_41775 [Streptomyces phaeochromogenes]WSJ03939.1 hypothetical protein OG437_09900 [Streptomyces phaeochromogenes]WSW13262.1 hypothetical protein OG277_09740 [Streptomyces phaeochromogenes]
MQSLKRPGRTAPKRQQPVVEPEPEGVESDAEEFDAYDTFEMYRVICPDCAQPIALLADEESLPEHALCASPWNPFGLTVCAGTGRTAAEARPADETMEVQEQDTALLLTLPQGLDWRTQPFSHVGGPGSRPMRVPVMRDQAA